MINMNVPLPRSVFEENYSERAETHVEDLVELGEAAESRLLKLADWYADPERAKATEDEEWQEEWEHYWLPGHGNFGEFTALAPIK